MNFIDIATHFFQKNRFISSFKAPIETFKNLKEDSIENEMVFYHAMEY